MHALATMTDPRAELDDVTLRRAQRGDAAAFRALVECYHVRVHALLWRMIERRCGLGRVEDLTQDTFLRVYRALPRFAPDGAARLSTWILTIATRLALNELRRAGRTEPLSHGHGDGDGDGDGDLAAPMSSASPESQLERRRLAAAIGDAVAKLRPDHRAVLILREYHAMDYDSIAAALAIDVGTVKSRLSRARAALRVALAPLRPDPTTGDTPDA